MEKFTVLTGVAAPLRIMNVDTDMIIPARYLKTIKRTGLGAGLFSSLRFDDTGAERPDFVLNQRAYRNATILIAGDNFGCGSSREHAPWALLDYGIRCVIAPSFADIFFNNCFKNGILPIALPEPVVEKLMAAADNGANATFTVDLEAQRIAMPDGESIPFEVEPFRRECLLNGWDDIGLTLRQSERIDAYEARQRTEQPWALG
ncbi:3-isopropylmalate dehydratase small subunit [Rhodospirillum centenum]|uniref:3-isopropylmalate dehydratase small subunit n=1 Tax=Rhodospirillum centenum (strain ATCC 51521 / SW) TaxID=414684 RepID=LEUD_RHOCS|nr:3-isopropylmalate dehydratase small subunit [Rhodospirillum centenum]B6IYC9.1 RecName: Full=3-isopropylmalate dehydratase small subunit; AltName: Full=Alpha-IPM isomerase; Short=IPMI; AltName: Full=Isopropylmalate isomerase [Rhodospirillum centenum SW]ACJ01303.1 3-isopropylmalate dehydratase, small subunit [Rhodospirillum centenum SW]